MPEIIFPVKCGYMPDSKGISVKSAKLVRSLHSFLDPSEIGGTGIGGTGTQPPNIGGTDPYTYDLVSQYA